MRVILLFSLFFLTNCTVIEVAKFIKKSSVHVFKETEFEEKKKGVIFFAVSSQDFSQDFFLKKVGLKGGSMEINGKKYKFEYKDFIYKGHYNYIVLEPGIYYLDRININSTPDSIRYYPSPGLVNDKFIYGGFEVKGGQVLDIGLLSINSKNGTFNIIEETEKIKQDLKNSHHPELIQKLKKGKFIMPGSTIIYKDGNYIYKEESNSKDFLIQKICTKGVLNIESCNPISNSK